MDKWMDYARFGVGVLGTRWAFLWVWSLFVMAMIFIHSPKFDNVMDRAGLERAVCDER